MAGHRILQALILLSLSAWSWAQGLCPGEQGEPIPDDPAQWAGLIQQLEAQAAACQERPLYLAYRGAVYNRLGQPGQAQALLERALLLAPGLLGAQLDYAESLAMLGQTEAAQQLLADLLTRQDIPEPMRQRIQSAWQALIQAGPRAQTRLRLAGAGGYDSNLNTGPRLYTLTLTTREGDIILPLANDARARQGMATLYELNLEHQTFTDQGRPILLHGEIRHRHAPHEADTDYTQYHLGLSLINTKTLPHERTALQLSGYSLATYGPAHFATIAWQGQWPSDGCRPVLEFEAGYHHHPQTPALDGWMGGMGGGLRCEHTGLILRGLHDHAQHARAGGHIQRLEIQLSHQGSVGPGVLQLDALVGRQQDSQGYSPLLKQDAIRILQRYRLRLDYRWPMREGFEGFVRLEHLKQDANLPLFEWNGTAIYLGLRWGYNW